MELSDRVRKLVQESPLPRDAGLMSVLLRWNAGFWDTAKLRPGRSTSTAIRSRLTLKTLMAPKPNCAAKQRTELATAIFSRQSECHFKFCNRASVPDGSP